MKLLHIFSRVAIVCGVITGTSFGMPAATSALSASGVVIAIVSPGNANANAEYVTIMNLSGAAVDLTGWRLQYRSAAGTAWTTKATLQGQIEKNSGLIVATTDSSISQPHQSLTPGMSQTGGHVQLVNGSLASQDIVGWGNAIASETMPVKAPLPTEKLERKRDTLGNYIDTDNNSEDFVVTATATEESSEQLPVITSPEGSVSEPVDSVQVVPAISGVSYPIEISEILPNPASPQTDAADEFVELYNPTSQDVDLSGYVLQSGLTFSHKYTVSGQSIPAHGYVVFYSRDTKLTLSNTAGQVRLIGPAGTVMDESAAYDTAKDGSSWSVLGGMWQWTKQPTPGRVNILASDVSKTPAGAAMGKSSSSAKQASRAAPKSSVSSTKKPAAKSASSTAASKKAAKSGSATAAAISDEESASKVHPLVLWAVGTGAIGYALYEYRSDISQKLIACKRLLRSRKSKHAEREVSAVLD